MFTLESALSEIYHFVLRFIKTYFASVIYCKQLIQKVRYRNTNDLINPYLFLIISFFIYFPIFNTVFFTDGDAPFILFAGINKFYTNYTLIEKLFIVSPLVILSEAVLALLSRLLIRDKVERTFFKNLYRYFTSSMLLTFAVTFSILQLLDYSLANLDNKRYYKLFDSNFSVFLMFLPVLIAAVNLILAILRDDLIFRKKPKLLSFLFIPLIGFLMTFFLTYTAYNIYEFYNARLSTNKLQLSSIESMNELNLTISNDSTNWGRRILKRDVPVSNDDSLVKVETHIFLKNYGDKENIIDLAVFRINASYYDSNLKESSSFYLRPELETAQQAKLLILKPGESGVVLFNGLLDVRTLKFIETHQWNREKYQIEYDVLPRYQDRSNHVIQKLFVRIR